MFSKISLKKWHILLLGVFILLCIFLRTYHFHDFLQFNPDQARDAMIVNDIVEGKTPLPLLGSIAGGTHFHLGPIFYYFGSLSAFFFGNYPPQIAFVDLFFSLLTLPFFFFFLSQYFTQRIALALSMLMGVSVFFVNISRFSWNPNSIPFFTLLFLFSLLSMMHNTQSEKKYLWPILVGISMGIGVQLHTFLLFIMPVTVLSIIAVQYVRKEKIASHIVFIFVFSLLLNIPQIMSEFQTGGENVKQFFVSSHIQTKGKTEVLKNIQTVFSCHMQTNTQMLFSIDNMEGCTDIFSLKERKRYQDTPGVLNNPLLISLIVSMSVLFSCIGYILFFVHYFKESDRHRKDFLLLTGIYTFCSLLLFIPVAVHMEPRYFVILFFVPFILFGLWLQFLLKYLKENLLWIFWLIIAGAIIINLTIVWKTAVPLRNHSASDTEMSVLGEVEAITDFIAENTEEQTVSLIGGRMYMKRFTKPLEYLLMKKGVRLVDIEDVHILKKEDTPLLFSIVPVSSKNYSVSADEHGYVVKKRKQFGRIIISILK